MSAYSKTFGYGTRPSPIRRRVALTAATASLCLIAACQTTGVSNVESTPVASVIPASKLTTEPRRLTAQGVAELDAGNFEAALGLFNKALYLDGGNSMLNFLTGVSYHLMALAGADAKYDLARQGYDRAIRLDASNWFAHYHAGLLELDLRNYDKAQNHLAEALILNPRDPDLLLSLIHI